MLDEEHGCLAAGPHLEEDRRETDGLARVETRRRLVEQQQQWVLHEGAPELDQAPVPMAQRLDRVVGDLVQAELDQQVLDPSHRSSRASAADQVLPEPAVGPVHPLCDHQVLAWAHPGEQLESLEGAPDPEAGTLIDRQPVDPPALETDLPRVEVTHTVQAVEQRRLPGAVRAHEAHSFAPVDGDRDIVERDDAAVTLGDPGALHECHVSRPLPGACANRRRSRPRAASAIPQHLRDGAHR